ncbi:MAG: HAD family hydrolase [bacterium]|nr:HAD family hydrolase [bacterium]
MRRLLLKDHSVTQNTLVIFDCDGVLVDSEGIANDIEAKALTALGYPVTKEESIKRFTGMSSATAQEKIFKESGVEIPPTAFDKIQQEIVEAFEGNLEPLMTEVLAYLEQKGTPRCVASSSPRSRVIRSLELTHQKDYFEDSAIFTAQQVKHGKPAPDLFLYASQSMGFSPENCLVIEDSPAGIEAALAAKMNVIGFVGGGHAQYDWYQDRLATYGVKLVKTAQELRENLKTI